MTSWNWNSSPAYEKDGQTRVCASVWEKQHLDWDISWFCIAVNMVNWSTRHPSRGWISVGCWARSRRHIGRGHRVSAVMCFNETCSPTPRCPLTSTSSWGLLSVSVTWTVCEPGNLPQTSGMGTDNRRWFNGRRLLSYRRVCETIVEPTIFKNKVYPLCIFFFTCQAEEE